MRAIAPLLAILVAAAIGYLVFSLTSRAGRRRSARDRARGRWQVHHQGSQGMTSVGVALMLPDGTVLDEHEVARFPDDAEDWSERFVRAKADAEERAFHLNADQLGT